MGCFEAGAITCGNFDCLCALFSTCQRSHWFHPYIHFFVAILVEMTALRSPCNGADRFLTVDGISECFRFEACFTPPPWVPWHVSPFISVFHCTVIALRAIRVRVCDLAAAWLSSRTQAPCSSINSFAARKARCATAIIACIEFPLAS